MKKRENTDSPAVVIAGLADEALRSREANARAIEQRLYELEADAHSAGFDFLAHLIGVAALASFRHQPEGDHRSHAPDAPSQVERS